MIGYVKWFNPVKGFGFIANFGGKDAFFHFSDIQCEGFKTVKDNTFVFYELEVEEKTKQLKARKVRETTPAEVIKQQKGRMFQK